MAVDRDTATGSNGGNQQGGTGSNQPPNPSPGDSSTSQPPLQDGGGIQQGNAPTTYDYQIVTQNAAIGGSYVAAQNSNITCNGSVAVFSRLCSFLVTNTSSGNINACSAYIGNFGFSASKSSSIDLISSVSSIHKFNYYSGTNSSLVTKFCTSSFPFDFSQYAAFNSSITNLEFETMTRWWDDDTGSNAVHFGSFANSFVQNASTSMAGFTIPSGFSGGIVGTQPLRFIWSEIYRPPNVSTTSTNLGTPGYASYLFVPFPHSIDYTNVGSVSGSNGTQVGGSSNPSGFFPGLSALIAYRNNYQSVKPPLGMFPPENGAAFTSEGGSLVTGSYSLATLVQNGFII